MSELETRLWQQLEAAADRQAHVPLSRRLPRVRLGLVVAVPVTLLAIALVGLVGTLGRPTRPAGTPEPITVRHVAAGLGEMVASEGAVWAHDPVDGELLRLDPTRSRVVARIPVKGQWPVAAIAADAGSVWVASAQYSTHRPIVLAAPVDLLRIDPGTNRIIARIPLRAPGGRPVTPAGVVTARGAVWVWGPSGAVRIDAGRDRVALDVPVGGDDVRGFGTDGDRVWMATESGHLLGFDAHTGARIRSFAIPPAGRQRAVVALADVVVLDRQDGTLEGIDPSTGRRRWRTRVGPAVTATTLDGDVLWATVENPTGAAETLLELDPHSGRIADRAALPSGRTRAIAAVGRELWIATDAGDVVRRSR